MKRTSIFPLLLILISNTLFGQTAPPLTSSISGVVWQESKPFNGTRSISEKTIPGILVKLLDAGTQEVIATALSNASGAFVLKANAGTYFIEYVFPTDGFAPADQRVGSDNSVNSASDADNFSLPFTIANNETVADFGLGLTPKDNTLTYCTQKESVVTEWNEALVLPKSTVTPLPINVKIFAAESVFHPSIGFENTSNANAYSVTTAGKITMTMPISAATFTMSSDVTIDGFLEDFDGATDYAGLSGITYYNKSSFASANPARNTSNAPIISNTFVGAENSTFQIPTKAQSSVILTGSGNLQTLIQTYVSAGACVVYTYASGALPVTLTSFNVKAEGKTASLTWNTTAETNSDRFDVEKSQNGKDWKVIGSVKASGKSQSILSYSFSDQNPQGGENLYRLKMIDLDNTYAYSRISSVQFKDLSSVVIFPNPVTSTLFVQAAADNTPVSIQILNNSGRVVKETRNVSQPVDISKIPAGTYFVNTLLTNGFSEKQKIVIAH